MSRANYKAQDFIDAIPGTGGIVSVLADRVGCAWNTAKKYVTEYATVAEVWENERERVLDKAEYVMIAVIEDLNKRVGEAIRNHRPLPDIDTADIKWFLAMKGHDRGYAKTEKHDLTTGGKPLIITEIVVEHPAHAESVED